jgi:anti-anti-sigma regulatory factor
MWRKLGIWLNTVPVHDPIDRQVAPLVQIAEISGIIMTILTSLMVAIRPLPVTQKLSLLAINLVVIAATSTALILLRRGRFMASIMTVTSVVLVSLTLSTLTKGLRSTDGTVLLAFAIPIVMASLLLGRRGLLPVFGLSTVVVLTTAALQLQGVSFVGIVDTGKDQLVPNAVSFVLIFGLLGLFLDRFGTSLRKAFAGSLQRERELEQIRATLSEQVAEQTVSLQAALITSEQHAQSLASAINELRTSQETLRELSAPILPVMPGVLIAPVVGNIDTQRAETLTRNILAAVEQQRTHYVIFDISGVPLVDTQVAQALLQTTMAVQLLGAKALLVGVRPEVAQTLVLLGCNLNLLQPYPTLQEALAALMQKMTVSQSQQTDRTRR